MNKMTLTILSKIENARLVGLCAKEMASESFNDIALAQIELAAVEIVNNCIEHACSDSAEHQICIVFCLSEDFFSMEMTDYGKTINAQWLEKLNSDFDFDHQDIENLPEGGMGLKIVKSCMDEMSYQQIDNANRWLLTKYRLAELS